MSDVVDGTEAVVPLPVGMLLEAWMQTGPDSKVEVVYAMPELDWWRTAQPGDPVPAVVVEVREVTIVRRLSGGSA